MEEQKQPNKINLLYQDDIKTDIKKDYTEEPKKGNSFKWIIISIIALAIIAIGAYAAYQYYYTSDELVFCPSDTEECMPGIDTYLRVCAESDYEYVDSCFRKNKTLFNITSEEYNKWEIENEEFFSKYTKNFLREAFNCTTDIEVCLGAYERDNQRISNILTINLGLAMYYSYNGHYPVSESLDKISGIESILIQSLPPYLYNNYGESNDSTSPLDPLNPERYYGYISDGQSYKLTFYPENQDVEILKEIIDWDLEYLEDRYLVVINVSGYEGMMNNSE